MTYPFAQSVTLIRRTVTGQDAYGNPTYGEAQTATTGVFAPGGSTEITAGGEQVTTQPTLYGVPAADLTAVDAVIVNGDRYEIQGEPEQYQPNPFTGWQPGLVIRLQRQTG